MPKPRICATITDSNIELIKEVEPQVDLFEVRIDLIGPDWPSLIKLINRPWIACNRSQDEGGKGDRDDVKRIEELMWAAEAGASIVDIEYRTRNLGEIVPLIKPRAECLISFHDISGTPSYDTLLAIAENQLKAGADICKIVTYAQKFEDNYSLLKLIHEFPEANMVAFAMGETGKISRILSPLAGGHFTYACLASGEESAEGQMTVTEMNQLFKYLR